MPEPQNNSLAPADVPAELALLAEEAAREHGLALGAATAAVEHALRAGKALLAAKPLAGHGGFGPWLARHVPFCQRTANRYMALARRAASLEPRLASGDPLSLRQALRALDFAEGGQRLEPPQPENREFSAGDCRCLFAEFDAAMSPVQVQALAGAQAHLHLWVEDVAQLHSAGLFARRAGFEPRGLSLWVEDAAETDSGAYWQGGIGFCLLAVRGDLPFAASLRAWFSSSEAECRRELLRRIELVSPPPRLLVQAGPAPPGWATLGREELSHEQRAR